MLSPELDQRGRDHTFVRERRWANTILTGITLRQYSTCSTSHDHQSCNLVRQHALLYENTLFWGPQTSQNRDFQEFWIFVRIKYHMTNFYGKLGYVKWTDRRETCTNRNLMMRLEDSELDSSFLQSNRELSSIKCVATHIVTGTVLGKYDPHRYYSQAIQHLLYESWSSVLQPCASAHAFVWQKLGALLIA